VVAPAFAGLPDPSLTAFGGSHWTRNLLAVSGACLALRREVLARLGGFDEGLTGPGSDVELCLRAVEAGLRVLHTPHARLVREGEVRRVALVAAELARPGSRHEARLRGGDPFHTPHLSLEEGVLVSDGVVRAARSVE
ncbi:MAG TPA: glycosyltransferase, partial [Myxococcaceae bacterium]|nr:glycosyltransferase [Myxococcaceae bacterium]